MVHPDTYISTTANGISLFAKRRFKKGEILWVADNTDNVIPLRSYLKLPKSEQEKLAYYCYLDSNQYIIIPCDNGKYVNHSCTPNCTYLIEFDNMSVAMRDIEAGEEITENYRCYYSHLADFECKCGAKDCVRFIKKDDSFCPSLRLRLDEVVPLIRKHTQPLLNRSFKGKQQFLTLLNKKAYEYCGA